MNLNILNFLQFLPSVWRCAADERIHYRNRGMPESGVFVVVGLLVLAILVAVILPYAQAAAAVCADGLSRDPLLVPVMEAGPTSACGGGAHLSRR